MLQFTVNEVYNHMFLKCTLQVHSSKSSLFEFSQDLNNINLRILVGVM